MRLNIDRTTYLRKENGHIPLTTEELLKLSEALGEEPVCFFLSGKAGEEHSPLNESERLLLKLYRSLNAEEKRDFFFSVRLMLKGVTTDEVRETLDRIIEAQEL